MICPKCGSDNVQFSTKTSGGGYSAGKGFCGWLLLGPLGFLCGACGSKTSTEEFWICNNCGQKFSKEQAADIMKQVNTEKQIAHTCEKYKQELTHPASYYKGQLKIAERQKADADAFYNSRFESLLDKYSTENKMVRKYKKKYCKDSRPGCVTLIIFVILGIISCIIGLVPIGAPVIIGGIVLGLISMLKESYRKYKVECLFSELDTKFKEYKERKDKAEETVDYWKGYVSKAEYVERNDKSNN
ncbi:MAG: hypothetical protein IJN99_01700 [Clostridia bacterium]|nr:hypothetical protein [Clostridia bacterium]